MKYSGMLWRNLLEKGLFCKGNRIQRRIAKDAVCIAGAQIHMRTACPKACGGAGGQGFADLRVARQGDMRRTRPRIGGQTLFVQGADERIVQGRKRGFALYTQDQDAVLRAAEIAVAVKRQLWRGMMADAGGQHALGVTETMLGHLAHKRQRDMMVLGQGIAAGNLRRGIACAACSDSADFIGQGQAEKQTHGRLLKRFVIARIVTRLACGGKCAIMRI